MMQSRYMKAEQRRRKSGLEEGLSLKTLSVSQLLLPRVAGLEFAISVAV
jgi:hypothetical protein